MAPALMQFFKVENSSPILLESRSVQKWMPDPIRASLSQLQPADSNGGPPTATSGIRNAERAQAVSWPQALPPDPPSEVQPSFRLHKPKHPLKSHQPLTIPPQVGTPGGALPASKGLLLNCAIPTAKAWLLYGIWSATPITRQVITNLSSHLVSPARLVTL
ncbi:hypothetical protein MATL_G00210930 [Megalops atlanticus]|uniref:Uncharacterized protein n=1 Tax=Megalops atlanticus TaxID=7932 RepID=A0A9D3PII0_MEGAT|nr:hypothetical protein MATL_G00210930 [Megalops atlanticus]